MIYLIVLVFVIALLIFYSSGKKQTSNNFDHVQVDYTPLLEKEISYYNKLDGTKKPFFVKKIKEFLDYVNIEGVGIEITDLDRVLIASSAIIPVFGFDGWKYKNLTNVILYPDTFDEHFQFEGESRSIMGMVGSG